MDVSFDIYSEKGDHLMVALSYYDAQSVSVFTNDPITLCLTFYDVTLVRKSGDKYVGYKVLSAISDILARFLDDNTAAVLCFYCDDLTDVERHNRNMSPQEYRSRLFSRMFDLYVARNTTCGLIDHCVSIDVDGHPRFAHFICQERYKVAVEALGDVLMEK